MPLTNEYGNLNDIHAQQYNITLISMSVRHGILTQRGRDKMATISQPKWIFWNANVWISLLMSPMFVPKVLIYNKPSLVHIMALRRAAYIRTNYG